MMLLGAGSSGGGGGGGVTAPETPGSFAATPGDRQITLSWESQPAADTFTIYFNTADNEAGATILTDTATGTNFVFDSGESIQAGEKYWFWIVAVNGAGSSASASASGRAYVTLANSASAVLTTPTGSWILSTLFFRSSGNLPASCQVVFDEANQIAASIGDGTWSDEVMAAPDYDPAISGAFQFSNFSGWTVTFWEGEPA